MEVKMFILATEAAAQPSPIMQMVFLGSMFFMMYYFIVSRPASKEKENYEKMTNSLIKGDKVVSIGGIQGEIVEVQDETITIKTGKNSTISIRKSAIKVKTGAENDA
jgi:preprotein translocase subunit YajC